MKYEIERNKELEEKVNELELKVSDLKEREGKSNDKAEEFEHKFNQRGVQLNRLQGTRYRFIVQKKYYYILYIGVRKDQGFRATSQPHLATQKCTNLV